MRLRKSAITVVVCLGLLSALPGWAGTVYLKDGSVLNGEVMRLRDGTLTLKTEYAGELHLSADVIRGLQTDKPAIVSLDNGDEVQGRLHYDTAGEANQRQRLTSDSFGERPLALQRLAGIRPVGAPSDAQIEAREKIAALKKKQAELSKDPWSGRLSLGIEGTSGNSDARNIDFSASALRETDGDRLSLSAEIHKARQEGEQTEDEYLAKSRLERDFTERTFAFVQADAEKDQFENIDLRFRLTMGPGYFFIREPEQTLKGRLGVGYEHESFTDGGNDESIVATLGYDYMVVLWDWNRFIHELTLIPQIDDNPADNFRAESVLADELPLGTSDSLWKLRAELRNDYNHNPEPGVEKLDTSYLLNIVREFE